MDLMSSSAQSLVLNFKEIDKHSLPQVGGKGANLGEMVKAGFPVPPGFAVTVASYDLFLKENQITEELEKLLSVLDVNDPAQLHQVSLKIQKLITKSNVPEAVKKDVAKAYFKLSGPFKKELVAVRSSATAEDLPGASFAGQQATFLNISGENSLLVAIKDCWASLFTERAIFYRVQNKINHTKVKISVIVQKMVQSEASGIMFTVDPVSGDKDKIIVDAVWGLGEMIVQGSVIPDHFVIQKDTFSILYKEISEQSLYLKKRGQETLELSVPAKLVGVQKISDEDAVKLAKIAQGLQDHYFFPQDIEWAKEDKKLYIVQTRPITTLKKSAKSTSKQDGDIKASDTPLLKGIPASPGIGSGNVCIISSPKEISKVKEGDVLVAPMTSPDYVPAMKKAVAIVTNEGGMTSHAAIVSRELGIPCVVGTINATETLKKISVVSVDGSEGLVYPGSKFKRMEEKAHKDVAEKEFHHKTATKIYINLAEPERARELSKLNVDGVGLLRAEFMMANIGIHPKEAIRLKTQDDYVDKLAAGMMSFCKNFSPRPVTYRASDFKTNEYRSLKGGNLYEPEESNPMLGYRGAYRYVSDREVFTLELRAIKKVMSKYDNLHLMIPFVRSPEELAKVRKIVKDEGLFDYKGFKFLMMVEIPVNVILLEDFIKVGIDGVSIGSNDLTMLVTGTDRDNASVAPAFNENSPAVMWAVRRTIKICNKHGISSSVCGQAPSVYDEFAEKLIKYGVSAISVNPDAVNRIRRLVYELERKHLNNS